MDQDSLRDEWARANRAGRAVNRRKALATVTSGAVTGALVLLGYGLFFALWPSDRVPVVMLSAPWLAALPVGWWIRTKLWPGGAFGS